MPAVSASKHAHMHAHMHVHVHSKAADCTRKRCCLLYTTACAPHTWQATGSSCHAHLPACLCRGCLPNSERAQPDTAWDAAPGVCAPNVLRTGVFGGGAPGGCLASCCCCCCCCCCSVRCMHVVYVCTGAKDHASLLLPLPTRPAGQCGRPEAGAVQRAAPLVARLPGRHRDAAPRPAPGGGPCGRPHCQRQPARVAAAAGAGARASGLQDRAGQCEAL
jgi:hypothetical protein